MTKNDSCVDILKTFYQRNIYLTKDKCFDVLNGNQEYGVFLKTAGDLVFLKCSKNNLIVIASDGAAFDDRHFAAGSCTVGAATPERGTNGGKAPVGAAEGGRQRIIKKIPCEFDFNYLLVGEICQDVIYIFDFLCISLTYKQRVSILQTLLLPSSCKLRDIYFPTVTNIFKMLLIFAQEIEQNEQNSIIFIPCNVTMTIHTLFQHPIYEWRSLKSAGVSSLLIRHKKVYCKISVEEFNEIHKGNVMFFKSPYFGIVFGSGDPSDSVVLCPAASETCTSYNLCERCDTNEEKVVDCVYTLSGWIPLSISLEKTRALKNNSLFQGPDNWKAVKELTDNFKNQLDFNSLCKL